MTDQQPTVDHSLTIHYGEPTHMFWTVHLTADVERGDYSRRIGGQSFDRKWKAEMFAEVVGPAAESIALLDVVTDDETRHVLEQHVANVVLAGYHAVILAERHQAEARKRMRRMTR